MATTKKNDATGEKHSVEFGGQTYSVPAAEDWDIEVLESIDDSKMTHALKALLGSEQYVKFRKNHSKAKELGEFVQRASEVVGAGNS